MNCKNKSFMTKKKAFTLIELLIVIAIIGILFIVLVSKVDFATDKAKATGVQTDFRSFQMALDTVAKENAGFNTFGWDTGDANQDGIRNSYDEGDTNKDGIQNGTEVFTGHKVYAETFTKVYSLKKNGTGSYDRDALNRLETAINANLDPKLHITIKDDGEIVMANGAQDPWNKEYHGWYITNAETDGKDRGAIVMYSDGANNEFGSEHTIANGIVTISIPGSNKAGKDDYSIVSLYTYTNGYGEVKNITTGFSNNQTFFTGTSDAPDVDDGNNITVTPKASLEEYTWTELKQLANMNLMSDDYINTYNINLGDYKLYDGKKCFLVDYDGNNYDGFVFIYISGVTGSMNDSNISNGGYVASLGAQKVENIYNALPEGEFKNAIKNVTVKCNDNKNNYTEVHEEQYHMFLPAHREVGGTLCVNNATYKQCFDAEGTMFDYFMSGTTNAACAHRKGVIIGTCWIRTVSPGSDNSFCYVSGAGGTDDYATSSQTTNLYPVFVIG